MKSKIYKQMKFNIKFANKAAIHHKLRPLLFQFDKH